MPGKCRNDVVIRLAQGPPGGEFGSRKLSSMCFSSVPGNPDREEVMDMVKIKEVEKKVSSAASCHAPACHAPVCHAPACHAPACHGPA
jgi:hypothetical protein